MHAWVYEEAGGWMGVGVVFKDPQLNSIIVTPYSVWFSYHITGLQHLRKKKSIIMYL